MATTTKRPRGRPISEATRDILLALEQHGWVSVEELSEITGRTQAQLHHIIWYARQHGWVERCLGLTREGIAAMKKHVGTETIVDNPGKLRDN